MTSDLKKILAEKTNAKIIWYLRESPRRYSEILKHLDERDSGKLNYHLKKLIAESLIAKGGETYRLTKQGVKFALYVDSLQLKEKYPLPVVLVAIRKGRKILLAKRCREPCKGMWGLPGNELLHGETPSGAAMKEASEELGLTITSPELYGAYPTIYREEKELIYHVVLLAVRTSIRGIPEQGKAKGKISEYRFFSKDELNDISIIPSNKKPILDAFSGEQRLEIQDL
jgi:ADP-ribose pyrophosphatase YjhB (NUDIX family)